MPDVVAGPRAPLYVARELIGNGSQATDIGPPAASRPPVTRRARLPPADFEAPIPNAVISAAEKGSIVARNLLVGAPLAESSLTA